MMMMRSIRQCRRNPDATKRKANKRRMRESADFGVVDGERWAIGSGVAGPAEQRLSVSDGTGGRRHTNEGECWQLDQKANREPSATPNKSWPVADEPHTNRVSNGDGQTAKDNRKSGRM
jgi:hypothetical protein